MNIGIYEDVISGVDEYVEDILAEGFEDVQLGHDLFKNVKITDTNHFSSFDLMKYNKLILTTSSLKLIEKRYS